jgi:hypothetical protein
MTEPVLWFVVLNLRVDRVINKSMIHPYFI